MTTERKLLIGGGVLLLFLLQGIAVFAVGVYVGRYGLTREGLTLQGPRAGQAAAPADPVQPAGPVLPGEPAVIGRVRRVTRTTLDLATREGPRQVMLDDETRYRNGAGELTGRDLLSPGQIVAVFGVYADDGRQLHADLVVTLPAQELGAEPGAPAEQP